jgi:hypothetical protein
VLEKFFNLRFFKVGVTWTSKICDGNYINFVSMQNWAFYLLGIVFFSTLLSEFIQLVANMVTSCMHGVFWNLNHFGHAIINILWNSSIIDKHLPNFKFSISNTQSFTSKFIHFRNILEPITGITFFTSGFKSDPTKLFPSIVLVITGYPWFH